MSEEPNELTRVADLLYVALLQAQAECDVLREIPGGSVITRRIEGDLARLCRWVDVLRTALPSGYVDVGTSEDGTLVLVNHPVFNIDADDRGYIAFSPHEARGFAELLVKHADECEVPEPRPGHE